MAIAGRVAIVPKGEWDVATNYKRLDYITYHNIAYVAKKDSVGQTPTGVSNQYWMLSTDVSEMTGATSSANGKSGIVPQPMAGDNNHVLFGDGIWKEVKSSALLIDQGYVAIDYSILGG